MEVLQPQVMARNREVSPLKKNTYLKNKLSSDFPLLAWDFLYSRGIFIISVGFPLLVRNFLCVGFSLLAWDFRSKKVTFEPLRIRCSEGNCQNSTLLKLYIEHAIPRMENLLKNDVNCPFNKNLQTWHLQFLTCPLCVNI